MRKTSKSKRRNKKSPAVSHTKGVYGFTKDYPEASDDNGFRRTGAATEKKMSAKAKIRLAAVLVAVFIVVYIAVSSSLKLSKTQPATSVTGTTAEVDIPIVSLD